MLTKGTDFGMIPIGESRKVDDWNGSDSILMKGATIKKTPNHKKRRFFLLN